MKAQRSMSDKSFENHSKLKSWRDMSRCRCKLFFLIQGSFHETGFTKKAWFEASKARDIPEDVLHTSSSMKFQVGVRVRA